MQKFSQLDHLLVILFCGAVAVLTLFKIPTYDTWFHLALGREIVQRYGVPHTEIFTYPNQGAPTIYPSWLYGLFLYLLYCLGGENALIIARVLLALMIFGVLFYDASRGHSTRMLSWGLLFIVLLQARERLYDRPELLSYLLVALFFLILNTSLQNGKKLNLFLLPLLQMLWINIHPSAVLGILIVGTYWFFGGIQFLGKQHYGIRLEGTPTLAQWKRQSLILFLVLFASLVNPFTYQPLFLPFKLSAWDIARDEITELQAPTLHIQSPYALILILLLLSFLLNWRKLYLPHLFLSGIFVYLSIGAIRFIPLMAIVAGPIMARNLGSFATRVVHRRLRASWYPSCTILASVFISLGIITGTWWQVNSYPAYLFGLGINRQRIPVQALDYIERNHIQGKMFNTFQFGGYIAWRNQKPFIDGRGELPPTLFEKALVAQGDAGVWREFEQLYGINYAVLAYPVQGNTSLERARAEKDWGLSATGWALVYWDDAALVYVKRIEEFKHLIERDEYRYVLPANDYTLLVEQVKDPAYGARVLEEVERAIQQQQGNSIKAHLIQGFVANQLGDYQKAITAYQYVLSRAQHEQKSAYAGLALAYSHLGETEKAIHFYKQVQGEYAEEPKYFHNLAALYERKGELETAVEYAKKALELDPNFLVGYIQLQGFYQKMGQEDLAATVAQQYSKALQQSAGEQHFIRGLQLMQHHKLYEAMEAYKESIRVNPYNPAAHTNLGFLYYDTHHLEKALHEHLAAIKIDPNWAEAHYGLALIYEQKGELKRAQEHWKKYLEIKPKGYWSRRAKERLQKLELQR